LAMACYRPRHRRTQRGEPQPKRSRNHVPSGTRDSLNGISSHTCASCVMCSRARQRQRRHMRRPKTALAHARYYPFPFIGQERGLMPLVCVCYARRCCSDAPRSYFLIARYILRRSEVSRHVGTHVNTCFHPHSTRFSVVTSLVDEPAVHGRASADPRSGGHTAAGDPAELPAGSGAGQRLEWLGRAVSSRQEAMRALKLWVGRPPEGGKALGLAEP
jgi:hypothetical protein